MSENTDVHLEADKGEYTIAGLDWWTGPVDWTGGLTFEAFCATH